MYKIKIIPDPGKWLFPAQSDRPLPPHGSGRTFLPTAAAKHKKRVAQDDRISGSAYFHPDLHRPLRRPCHASCPAAANLLMEQYSMLRSFRGKSLFPYLTNQLIFLSIRHNRQCKHQVFKAKLCRNILLNTVQYFPAKANRLEKNIFCVILFPVAV